jgi:Zn-dependent oligopeptidase
MPELRVMCPAFVLRYTHLPVVLDGLAQLTQRLFDVTLHIRPAAQREAWAPDLLRVDAYHQGSCDLIGTVYLDLCSRTGKYPSAVTFPIRCGRELPDGKYQVRVLQCSSESHNSPMDGC